MGADAAQTVLLTKEDNGQFTLDGQTTLKLQAGGRPDAYSIIHGQFTDYVKQHQVQCVCFKGSAVSLGGTKLAHLQAAELRGVLQAAAAGATEVRTMTKSAASRNFGTRKVDEYLKDDSFWTGSLATVKKGLREAAFAAISEFSK